MFSKADYGKQDNTKVTNGDKQFTSNVNSHTYIIFHDNSTQCLLNIGKNNPMGKFINSQENADFSGTSENISLIRSSFCLS